MKAKNDDKKRQYEKAIAAYNKGDYKSYRSCAIAYGVTDTRLRQYILFGMSYTGCGLKSKVLNGEEERELAEFIKQQSRLGFGLTYYDVQLLVQELIMGVKR